ncbi:hypothetical protein [Shewanella algae]|uniref:hypothetical protein n=1 Tax=Shewanella algae TaxID=38313 RepID=UPI00313D50CF
MLDLRQAQQRLKSFLLRHGHPCTGRQNWTEAYRRHLADINFPQSATKITFQHYIHIVIERYERLQRLELELQSLAKNGAAVDCRLESFVINLQHNLLNHPISRSSSIGASIKKQRYFLIRHSRT